MSEYSYQVKKHANDELVSQICEVISKKHPEDYQLQGYRNQLRQHVHFQLMITDAQNELDNNPEVIQLEAELQRTQTELRVCEDQLIQVANHLGAECGVGVPPEDADKGDSLGNACIRKIDAIIPDDQTLGEMIESICKSLPAYEQPGRSQCFHLAKLLRARMKNNG